MREKTFRLMFLAVKLDNKLILLPLGTLQFFSSPLDVVLTHIITPVKARDKSSVLITVLARA